MAKQSIEVTGTAALEKGRIWGDLASASIVTGVGDAETVSGS